jgi:hypothetical protein
MIQVIESSPQRLMLKSTTQAEPLRGAAYVAFGLLFVGIGIQQGRTLLIILGVVNVLFSFLSFRPIKDEASVTLDREVGAMVYDRNNVGGASSVAIPLRDVVSGEIEVRKTLFRSLYRLSVVLSDGRKLPLGVAPDKNRKDKEEAAGHLRLFLENKLPG